MTSTMTGPPDHDLERALRDLAEGAGLPATPLADDLRRGRRRLRLRRAGTAVGASVAAAAVAVAVVVGSTALQPKPSAPVASGAARTVAPAGDGSGVTATAPVMSDPMPSDAPDPAYDQAAVAEAVVRHLDPQSRHYPGKETHYDHWSGLDRLGTTAAFTDVPWVESDHRSLTGVSVRIMRDSGPQCSATPGEAWGVPSCRTVRLGGVAVTKVTFAEPGARSPEYWRKNTKGAWVAVNAYRVDDAVLTTPRLPNAIDVTPLPEMGIDESDIGPLLTDPALDVTLSGS